MRSAILIFTIMGFVVSLGSGAFFTLCAGCQGGVVGLCTPNIHSKTKKPGGEDGVIQGGPTKEELLVSYRKLFWANIVAGMGVFLQSLLILIGGVMTFTKLGTGESGKTGALVMAGGLGISVLSILISIAIASTIEGTITLQTEEALTGYFMFAFITNILPIFAVVLGFVAKPEVSATQPVPVSSKYPPQV